MFYLPAAGLTPRIRARVASNRHQVRNTDSQPHGNFTALQILVVLHRFLFGLVECQTLPLQLIGR